MLLLLLLLLMLLLMVLILLVEVIGLKAPIHYTILSRQLVAATVGGSQLETLIHLTKYIIGSR